MKEFFKNLFSKWACHHEWREWTQVRVNDDLFGSFTIHHFVCNKCGKFKKVKSS